MTRRDLAALSGFTASALGFTANETLHIGCLGAGGRCRHLLQSLVKIPGVRIAAVCDVWERHREMARALADPGRSSPAISAPSWIATTSTPS